jgi:adenosine/AMP kinase
VLGVADGSKPLGIEAQEDIRSRRELLCRIGCKS